MNKKNILLFLLTLIIGSSLCLSATAATPKATGDTNASAAINFIGGDLTFYEAPTIRFGVNQLKARTHSYSAKTVTDQGRLTDARGTHGGWSVRASLTQFNHDGEASLKGSSIVFASKQPTPINSGGKVPSYFPETEVVSGDSASKTIWSAQKTEGGGHWSMQLAPKDVSLKVLGGTGTLGKHYATIHWSLLDAPAT